MKVTPLRVVGAAAWIAVLIVGGAILWFANLDQRDEGPERIGTPAIGGPFALTDQAGATVTEAALRGRPSALFFGYTFCPDVCPTTLADMTVWLEALGAAGARLGVYFVTVDPERDTQQQLAAYLSAFDPRIVGLTGSRAAIDAMLKEFGIYSAKVEGTDGAYTMDHSASVYLFDSNEQFVGTASYREDTDTVLAKLWRLIEGS